MGHPRNAKTHTRFRKIDSTKVGMYSYTRIAPSTKGHPDETRGDHLRRVQEAEQGRRPLLVRTKQPEDARWSTTKA